MSLSSPILSIPSTKMETLKNPPISLPNQLNFTNSRNNNSLIIRNGPILYHNLIISNRIRRSLSVHAKKSNNNDKKKNNNNNNKVDSHSFVAMPNESTGPFPEAVLLKQKKVQEDGKVLPEFADEDEEELFEFLNLQLESDLGAAQMRHYEVIYMIHQDHQEKVNDVNTKIRDFLREKKGRVWRFSDWGMRRLAYKIQKATHAHYILMNFELGTQWINEFKQLLDQDERVIRHLVIKRDKAITENCPPPPEFHTLRGDMVDEYDVDDFEEDDDEDDDELYDDDEQDDLEGDEDDDIDVKDGISRNAVQETDSPKVLAKGKSNTKREKVLR